MTKKGTYAGHTRGVSDTRLPFICFFMFSFLFLVETMENLGIHRKVIRCQCDNYTIIRKESLDFTKELLKSDS